MKPNHSLIAAVFMFSYGAWTPAEATDFPAEMESEKARWLAAYTSRDAQAFGPMYSSDATLLAQGNPPIVGRTAIVQFWFEMFKKGFLNPTLEIISSRQEGRLAYQTCQWSVIEPGRNGPARRITGNTLRIFERQRDGRWLITVQMSNSDDAPAIKGAGVTAVFKGGEDRVTFTKP